LTRINADKIKSAAARPIAVDQTQTARSNTHSRKSALVRSNVFPIAALHKTSYFAAAAAARCL
jgi:hypothetical protein